MELRPYLFCHFLCLLYFFLPPFEDNGLLLWVPHVLCQHSEVVLWNLLSMKCSFHKFVGEKVFSLSYSSANLGPPINIVFMYLGASMVGVYIFTIVMASPWIDSLIIM